MLQQRLGRILLGSAASQRVAYSACQHALRGHATLPAPADMIRILRDRRALEPRDQGASARRLIIAVGSPSLIGGVATT